MNASRPTFLNAARSTAPRLALLGGCCLVAAGCTGVPFTDAKIDPASPVAGDVARMTRQDAKFPTFAGIPPKPKDVRPVAQYGRDARSVMAAGDALVAATEPSTWTLQGTESFADRARSDAGPQVEPPKPGDAEAFARELRERATPPPPR
jgi:hypothetical protein